MKKRKRGRQFNRDKAQRKALLKNLAESLFVVGKIKTTEAKAKELSSFAEKLITKAKKGDLNNRREVAKVLSPQTTKKLVDEIAPKYKKRQGGYTRIFKLGSRENDGAKMAIIELVD